MSVLLEGMLWICSIHPFYGVIQTYSYLSFCLDNLSTDETGVLKSPTIAALLSVPHFSSVDIVLDIYVLQC